MRNSKNKLKFYSKIVKLSFLTIKTDLWYISNFGSATINFDNNNQVLNENGNSHFTADISAIIGHHLGFFKIYIFSKIAANLFEIGIKYLFTA